MEGWGEEMNTGEGSGLWSLPCEEGLGEDSTENKVIKGEGRNVGAPSSQEQLRRRGSCCDK